MKKLCLLAIAMLGFAVIAGAAEEPFGMKSSTTATPRYNPDPEKRVIGTDAGMSGAHRSPKAASKSFLSATASPITGKVIQLPTSGKSAAKPLLTSISVNTTS